MLTVPAPFSSCEHAGTDEMNQRSVLLSWRKMQCTTPYKMPLLINLDILTCCNCPSGSDFQVHSWWPMICERWSKLRWILILLRGKWQRRGGFQCNGGEVASCNAILTSQKECTVAIVGLDGNSSSNTPNEKTCNCENRVTSLSVF